MQQINIQYYNSPYGELILASVGEELCLCDWNEMPCAERNKLRLLRYMKAEFKIETSSILELAKKQLDEYFTDNRKIFEFRCILWEQISRKKYGMHCLIYHMVKPEAIRRSLKI